MDRSMLRRGLDDGLSNGRGASQLGAGRRVAVDRLLKVTHAASERAAHLRQALGAEHQQQDDQQKCEVNRFVKSHQVLSVRLRFELVALDSRDDTESKLARP